MRRFLCLGCLSLLAKRRGHICRIPYPKIESYDTGVARIGVFSLLCTSKLWIHSWRIQSSLE